MFRKRTERFICKKYIKNHFIPVSYDTGVYRPYRTIRPIRLLYTSISCIVGVSYRFSKNIRYVCNMGVYCAIRITLSLLSSYICHERYNRRHGQVLWGQKQEIICFPIPKLETNVYYQIHSSKATIYKRYEEVIMRMYLANMDTIIQKIHELRCPCLFFLHLLKRNMFSKVRTRMRHQLYGMIIIIVWFVEEKGINCRMWSASYNRINACLLIHDKQCFWHQISS